MMAGSGKGCEGCREWQEHYYWEHMDVNKIRFFKLMTGNFQQQISIPDKFASNFIRQMQTAEGLDLKAPSGKTWHVDVTKVANELFLGSGWGEFAKAHELQENDLLIFTCAGRSSFEVLIFDASGCEKLSPLFAGRMRKHFNHMVDQQVQQYSVTVDSDSDSDDDTGVPCQLVGSPHKASASKKYSARTKPRKELPESPDSASCDLKLDATEEEESDHDSNTDSDYYYSKSMGQLNDDEKQEIIGLASTRPGNPAFVAVLKRTHLQRKNNFLIVPCTFAADHLQRRPTGVLLFRPGREEPWPVSYYHSSHTRGFNCQRWVSFVRDNGLRKGDVCVFELIKGARKKMTMAVHVARKRKADGRFVKIIPSKVVAYHLEGRSHEMLLLRPNKREKWHVKYYHASFTRGFNCRRWAKFIRDNRLREGYVCIIELMKGARKATMTVHVFRKVKERFVLLG